MSNQNTNTLQYTLLGLMRILVGYMFVLHGTSKLLGFPEAAGKAIGFTAGLHSVAGVLELFVGFLILIGLFTKWAAFLLSGEMAFAYFIGHVGVLKGTFATFLFPVVNGGDAAILYSFLFLIIFFLGHGAFAVDSILKRRKA